jgi:hypothetical protein
MPETPYITIRLAGESIDLPQTDDFPISIDYEIEDGDDFRQKKSGVSLNITVPATLANSRKLNTLFNPGAEDFLPDGGFDKPLDVVIIAAGNELMKGKAFVLSGRKQYGKPKDFEINCFGDNADWVIANKELTLHDVVSSVTHMFTKDNIEASWLYDAQMNSRTMYMRRFGGANHLHLVIWFLSLNMHVLRCFYTGCYTGGSKKQVIKLKVNFLIPTTFVDWYCRGHGGH